MRAIMVIIWRARTCPNRFYKVSVISRLVKKFEAMMDSKASVVTSILSLMASFSFGAI